MAAARVAPLCLLLQILCGAALCEAVGTPAIRRQGVVNAASQRPAAVGGAIARGSWISIHGIHFGAGIAGNRVVLRTAAGDRALSVSYADPQRIDAWIPVDVAPGEARIAVSSGGLESAPEAIVILKSAPGLFSANGEGWGPARSSNGPANSVAPGGQVTIDATGLTSADKPEIRVGNAAARVLSIQTPRAPNFIAEITLRVPAEGPEGCYVPVYARLPGSTSSNGSAPSNTVTIAVHRGGGVCVSTPGDPAPGGAGGKTGTLLVSRTVTRRFDSPREHTEDQVDGAFADVPGAGAPGGPRVLPPPPGACVTYAAVLKTDMPIDASIGSLLFGVALRGGLDAGVSMVLRNQGSQVRVPFAPGVKGLYRMILSANFGRVSTSRLSLDSGSFGFTGAGGAQVGPFRVALAAPAPFTVANPPADRIDRSKPLTVEWSGAHSGGSMAIVIAGSDANLNVAGLAYCTAPESAGRFTIPADLLGQVPAGRGNLVIASWLGQVLTPAPSGVTRMTGVSVYARSFEVQIEKGAP